MINIIVAMTGNRVIGNKGKIPWYIPEDLKNFKKLTTGHIVVMGRTTFESLPMEGGLPNRSNIVISRKTPVPQTVGNVMYSNKLDIELFKNLAEMDGKELFIIGGANIYDQTWHLADRMYLSLVKAECEGDAFFPDIDWSDWTKVHHEDCGSYVYLIMKKHK